MTNLTGLDVAISVLGIVAVFYALWTIAGRDVSPASAYLLAAVGGLVFTLRSIIQGSGHDFYFCWRAGRYVLVGINPYTIIPPPGTNPYLPLHSPNALGVFAVVGLVPYPVARMAFYAVSIALGLAMVPLAWITLSAVERRRPPGLTPPIIAVLSAAFFLSGATNSVMAFGQLSLVVAGLVLAAVFARAQERPGWAGVLLAMAAIKINTAAPNLLLFVRRPDRWAWLSFGAMTMLLCVVATPPSLLPSRVRDNLKLIRAYEQPGGGIDYSIKGPLTSNIIGFQHLLDRLGLRDRELITRLQYVAIGVLGVAVAWGVRGGKLTRGGADSLVLLFSTVFLYHRIYDTVILAMPLVHAVGRALSDPNPRRGRRCFAGSAIAILLTLTFPGKVMTVLTTASLTLAPALKYPIQAIVLPYATWMILAAMVLLYLGEHRAAHGRSQGQA